MVKSGVFGGSEEKYIFYNSDNTLNPFRVKFIENEKEHTLTLHDAYYHCDGKTLWTKIEDKPKKKTISLAMFTYYINYNTHSYWSTPEIYESIEKFMYGYPVDEYHTSHHEIPNTRYEIKIKE